MTDKPDCYKCKHVGRVPGDTHKRCNHPRNEEALDNPLGGIFSILASVRRLPPIQAASTGINVEGDPYGRSRGWFNWPWNFDPTWLLSCDGFEEAEELKERGD